jgi:HSP20 family protein
MFARDFREQDFFNDLFNFGDTVLRYTNSVKNRLPSKIEKKEEEYIVTVQIPGLKEDDVSIDFKGETLSVTSKYKDDAFYKDEEFVNEFIIPSVDVEKVTASLKAGRIIITLPKLQSAQNQKIKINAE